MLFSEYRAAASITLERPRRVLLPPNTIDGSSGDSAGPATHHLKANQLCSTDKTRKGRRMEMKCTKFSNQRNMTIPTDGPCQENEMVFGRQTSDAPSPLRSTWESAAREVLSTPVTLRQFCLKMLLRGIEKPDISLMWLAEWKSQGKVVELEDGYFQLAEQANLKEK